MPHKPLDKGGNRTNGSRHYLAPPVNPFAADASTDSISDWDIRPDQLAEFVLGYLGRGQAVMFGVSRDGGSVSIAVNIGEKQWARKHCVDAGEFIGVIYDAVRRLRIEELPEVPETS